MPRRLWITTSARRANSCARGRSPSEARSRVRPSLLRLTQSKYALEPSVHGGPHDRVSSPVPGRSTLTTVAPRSASVMVASGPARTRLKSATTSPDSGPLTVEELSGTFTAPFHRMPPVAAPPSPAGASPWPPRSPQRRDRCHLLGGEGSAVGGRHAFRELGAVLHAQHHRRHAGNAQRVTV